MTITTLIIIITAIISYVSQRRQDIMQKLIMHPYTVSRKKQYYRLLTSGFIHNGLIHFFFNMLALYFFGPYIEAIFKELYPASGTVLFIIFYLTAIVVSDLTSLRKHKDNPGYFSLGASGAVSAVVFSWIMFFPTRTIYVYFIPMPGFILGALYLIYSYYQSKNPNSHINHDAHLWGSIYGILFTTILYPSAIPRFIQQLSEFEIF
jgi:membrane associated rhomboid family serine protease